MTALGFVETMLQWEAIDELFLIRGKVEPHHHGHAPRVGIGRMRRSTSRAWSGSPKRREGKPQRVKPLPLITETPGAPKALHVGAHAPSGPAPWAPAPPRPTSGAMAARPVRCCTTCAHAGLEQSRPSRHFGVWPSLAEGG